MNNIFHNIEEVSDTSGIYYTNLKYTNIFAYVKPTQMVRKKSDSIIQKKIQKKISNKEAKNSNHFKLPNS